LIIIASDISAKIKTFYSKKSLPKKTQDENRFDFSILSRFE